MTLTERIDSALKEPRDIEVFDLAYKQSTRVTNARHPHKAATELLYTFLLERKALLAQVEAERWRDAEKEKPEKSGMFLAVYDDGVAGAEYDAETGNWFGFNPDGFLTGDSAPTHWKPINLP